MNPPRATVDLVIHIRQTVEEFCEQIASHCRAVKALGNEDSKNAKGSIETLNQMQIDARELANRASEQARRSLNTFDKVGWRGHSGCSEELRTYAKNNFDRTMAEFSKRANQEVQGLQLSLDIESKQTTTSAQ